MAEQGGGIGASGPEGEGGGARRFQIEGKSLGYPARFPDASSAVAASPSVTIDDE